MVKSGKTYWFWKGFCSKTRSFTPYFYFRNVISTHESIKYQKLRKSNKRILSHLSHLMTYWPSQLIILYHISIFYPNFFEGCHLITWKLYGMRVTEWWTQTTPRAYIMYQKQFQTSPYNLFIRITTTPPSSPAYNIHQLFAALDIAPWII